MYNMYMCMLSQEDRLSESFVYSSRESSRAPSALATAPAAKAATLPRAAAPKA